MDFFQRIGNFFSGKGWINDEEKRRKEQQVQPAQPQPKVTFNNQANTNARWNNTFNWINSSSPAAMKPTNTLKADTAPQRRMSLMIIKLNKKPSRLSRKKQLMKRQRNQHSLIISIHLASMGYLVQNSSKTSKKQ